MKVPIIDYAECLGCESCAILCPEVFYIEHDKAWVYKNVNYDAFDMRDAWRSCPARCITFVEVDDEIMK